MRRYWIEPSQKHEQEVHFEGDQFHHIFDVCRQDLGSRFEVLLQGQAYLVEVTSVEKRRAKGRILEIRQIQELPKPYINLALCIPRFHVLESLLEKAVEMGVQEIQLLSSDYSFVKKSEKLSSGKWERWQKIIKSATQQTGRGDLLTLHPPVPLQEFTERLNRQRPFLCLFGYEGSTPLGISDYFQKLETRDWNEAWVLVGAEGGFSGQEVEKLQSQGVQAVTLGPQILRVETACLAFVSILKYELGLMRGRT